MNKYAARAQKIVKNYEGQPAVKDFYEGASLIANAVHYFIKNKDETANLARNNFRFVKTEGKKDLQNIVSLFKNKTFKDYAPAHSLIQG